jgi:hypothetical protein
MHYRNWHLQLVPKAALAAVVASTVRVHAVLHPSQQLAYLVQQTIFQAVPTLLGVATVVTFSRLVWWVAPDDKRNRSTLGLPPALLSTVWAGMLFVPDVVKAVGGLLGRPKPGAAPNPASLLNRAQSVAWLAQFFFIAGWALWALRFMGMSRRWLIGVDAVEARWRRLGWTCVACGALLSVGAVHAWKLEANAGTVAGLVRDARV